MIGKVMNDLSIISCGDTVVVHIIKLFVFSGIVSEGRA